MSRGVPPPRRGRLRAEAGSATVFATACLGFLLVVGAGLGVVAAMFVGHRSAQAAADLAALAGAGAEGRGEDACAAAAAVAGRNGGELTDCEVEGPEVSVAVTVAGPRWLGQTGDLTGRARAGPVRSPPPVPAGSTQGRP